MEFKNLLELIKTVNESEISDFRLKEGEFELRISSGKFGPTVKEISVPQVVQPIVQPSPAAPVAPVAAPTPQPAAAAPAAPAAPVDSGNEAAESTTGLIEVKSPIVGTFYRSASPDKPAYVKVGDTIQQGDVVCIVEAMKLFNEIESEISGKIVKVMIEDASPVEYDQVLFLVEPA